MYLSMRTGATHRTSGLVTGQRLHCSDIYGGADPAYSPVHAAWRKSLVIHRSAPFAGHSGFYGMYSLLHAHALFIFPFVAAHVPLLVRAHCCAGLSSSESGRCENATLRSCTASSRQTRERSTFLSAETRAAPLYTWSTSSMANRRSQSGG